MVEAGSSTDRGGGGQGEDGGMSSPEPDPHTPSRPGGRGSAESIKLIGGLLALTAGLLVLAAVAATALAIGSDNAVKIATAAFGVIGTLVGAYFGQKVGSDGVKEARTAAEQEATKAQIYAAHLPAHEAPQVIALAHAAATGETLPPSSVPGAPGG